ncbi:related to Central kinetochore subunit CTF3 [Zygosaccharomyces bailii]|nr:related to Central kinetochore subunit CTF3 [Zygosaccharomyces bailii]
MELGEAVQLIVNSNAETPELELRGWLDHLYFKIPQQGLSSSQLQQLINFICESPVLSTPTKLYIVDNFLLPNDYVKIEVIREVMRHLGTANAVSPYKLEVPLNVQNALCKWIVNIFFLLLPLVDKRTMSKEDSVWIHLWQYDYLQKWLTYILVWSTTSAKDIRPWKIELLRRVGCKPGYTDAQACATLILKRYESLIGASSLISSALSDLNCNGRKLRTLQEFQMDANFKAKLKNVLTKNPTFTDDVIDGLITSQLATLHFTREALPPRYHPKVPTGKVSLFEIRTLDQLAWNWDRIVASKDVEQIVEDGRDYIPLIFMFSLNSSDQSWDLIYDWLIIRVKNCLKGTNKTPGLRYLNTVIKVCQVHSHLTIKLFEGVLTYDNFKINPSIFLYIFTSLAPLLVVQPGSIKGLHKHILQLLTSCYLDDYDKRTVNAMGKMCNALLLVINYWFEENRDDLTSLGLDLIGDLQVLLIPNLHYNLENRFDTIAVMLLLRTIPKIKYQEEVHLKRLMLPCELMNRLIVYDDPLLLDSCCYYLINTKDFLTKKDPSNTYVHNQNCLIMDLTNYLWRNKILQSKKFLNMPTEFVRNVLDNLFLPNASYNHKFTFSVTGIPSLSYLFSTKLTELEARFHTKTHYNYLINEDGFRNFLKNNKDFDFQWLTDIKNVTDLKLVILREIYVSSPFKNISLFLFTYLKSLSHYMHE